MKIGVLNFHFARNYGAVLECLALVNYLKMQGHDVQVIDYQPYYQMQYYLKYPNFIKCGIISWKKNFNLKFMHRLSKTIKWQVQTVLNYRYAKSRALYTSKFEPFVNSNFELSRKYNDKSINSFNSELDLLICGSDQIWNPDVTWGVDKIYYGNFGFDCIKKRVIYAASPCNIDLKKYGTFVKDYSKCLDKISLREKERQLDFEHLLETEISICPDPTLLLERKDYEKFEEDIDLPSKYILLYGFHDDEYVKKVEKVLSTFDSDEYEIIDLSIDKIFIKDHKVLNLVVTPGQFLTCFKNASYVITNSFHGTVFSIIYEKKFITILKSNTGGRMKELLSVLNLERRIFDSSRLLEDVDYEQVRIKLKDYRLIGSRYLESVL